MTYSFQYILRSPQLPTLFGLTSQGGRTVGSFIFFTLDTGDGSGSVNLPQFEDSNKWQSNFYLDLQE